MSEGYKATELGQIPQSWNVYHVRDFILDKKGAIKIGPFGSQLKKDSMVQNGIKVYGQENIFEKDMSYGSRFITEEHYQRLKTCELLPGDFIISMMGTIGKCMVVPEGIHKGVMDSHLLRLQLNTKIVASSFLAHLFTSPLVLNQVKRLAVGGIMDGLSSTIVKRLLFVCPPLQEQQKIAKILSTIDEKIDVIDAQITQTQELKKGLMQKLLTKGIGHTKFKDSPVGQIPKSWNVYHVKDFILDKKGAIKIGPFGSQLKKDSMVQNGIKVYGQENIFEKDMSYGSRFITEEHYQRLKTCELLPGDFIISMMGTIGKCMVVPEGIHRGVMDSHLLRLQLNTKIVSSSFLAHLFNSPMVLNQVKRLAVGGIMDGLSSTIVKRLLFACPPLQEQQKIATILNSLDKKLEVMQEKKACYQTLKKGLMQQLLTGKIRVNHLIEKEAFA